MTLSIVACSMTTVDLGLAFAPERAAHNLAVYRTIAEEIACLREIDLSARHPAVIFDPLRAYASWPSRPKLDEPDVAARRTGSESSSESSSQLTRERER